MALPLVDTAQRHRLWVVGSYIEAHCWRVARLPQRDESQPARSYIRECAGKGLAVALGAHRLGAAVDLLMAVGHDAAGDAALQLLQAEGLAAAHVHRLGPHSGQGCGLIGEEGGSSVTIFPGANALLGAEHLRQAAPCIPQAGVAYAQCEVPLPTVAQALAMAQVAGATTVLNPSPWSEDSMCSAVGRQALAAAGVIVVNRCEAGPLWTALTGQPLAADALHALPVPWLQALWQQWPGQWLVITLGEQGCVAYGRAHAVGHTPLRLPAHPVPSVQPIGAGDAFSAGLCTALAQGLPMARALAMANACGALAASHDGILEALPQRKAVDALLQS